jgi:hypothetical protein
LYNYCQAMGMKDEGCYIKPKLTLTNTMQRLHWILMEIDISDPNHLVYYHQYDEVSIDASWFFLQ